ncbi:hypothetical protein [Streptomyces sp. PTD5-9]|uniref:hypothetical protein n=1 Tax=Streptomyces sp. PTD5-9 TaxID=3120150 RepID=UPI003008921D
MPEQLCARETDGLVALRVADMAEADVGDDFDLSVMANDTLFTLPSQGLQIVLRTFVSDGVVRTCPETSRCSWPAELDLMAAAEALRLVGRWADWAGGAFTRSADRHISLYRRTA